MMKFVYADPPYPGMAMKHYSHDPQAAEVDYNVLMGELMQYDAWALSMGSIDLYNVLRMPNMPAKHRIGAWVKPFASFKPNVNPAYTWEAVIFYGGRELGRDVPTVRDFVSANITMQRGLAGVKPHAFNVWIFEFLGARPDDEFVDLYPGSGAVSDSWRRWCANKTGNWQQLPIMDKEVSPME
jgi:hypothetical protein